MRIVSSLLIVFAMVLARLPRGRDAGCRGNMVDQPELVLDDCVTRQQVSSDTESFAKKARRI